MNKILEIVGYLNGDRDLLEAINPLMARSIGSLKEEYRKDDRGYSTFEFLSEYLFGENGIYKKLFRLTLIGAEFIPAMEEEAKFLVKLYENIGKPMMEIMERKADNPILYPEEFASVVAMMYSFLTYTDYRYGFNRIRESELRNEFFKHINKYKRSLEAFMWKKSPYSERIDEYRPGNMDEYGYVVFFVVTSQNGCVILERIKGNKNAIWEDFPAEGLKKVCIEGIEKSKEKFQNFIRNRDLKNLCHPNYLSLSIDWKRFHDCYNKIYGSNAIPMYG